MVEDIEMLQLCNSKAVFQLASTFKSNDGIQLYAPSTNNALEGTNKAIKDDGTFRERHVLSRFLAVASNIVNNWSVERDASSINAKIFAIEPTISL